jgi:hypothetical protein
MRGPANYSTTSGVILLGETMPTIMSYMKREFTKLLPFALLFGALGGILLILANNLLTPSLTVVSLTYVIGIGSGVYILNNMRFRKDTVSSVLYGYMVYSVMTLISFVDMTMNANSAIKHPMFENLWAFFGISAGVLLLSGLVSMLTGRKTAP